LDSPNHNPKGVLEALVTLVAASLVATLVAACSVPTLVEECLDRTLEGASLAHRAVLLETLVVRLEVDCLDSPSLVEAFLEPEAAEAAEAMEAVEAAVEALGLDKALEWAKASPAEVYLEAASGKPKPLVVVCLDNQLQLVEACLARAPVAAYLDNQPLVVAASSDRDRPLGAVVALVALQLAPRPRCRRSSIKKPS